MNTQVLQNAIAKAAQNGWDSADDVRPLLLSKEFAQTLFGDAWVCGVCRCQADDVACGWDRATNHVCNELGVYAWEYHLGRLAVSADPLAYLQEFVPELAAAKPQFEPR